MPDNIANSFGCNDKISAAQNGRTHEEPAHCVRTVGIKYAVDIGIIAQMLAHFLPVVAQNDSVADDIFKRGTIEKRGRHDMQSVKPPSCLTDIFDNVIARKVTFEEFFIFERIMELRKRH